MWIEYMLIIPCFWSRWQWRSHTTGPITPGSSPSTLPWRASREGGTFGDGARTVGVSSSGSSTSSKGPGISGPLNSSENTNNEVSQCLSFVILSTVCDKNI